MRTSDVKSLVEGWLLAAERDALVKVGPEDPDYPNSFVTVTATGGPGYRTEGTTDVLAYQFKVAGNQEDFEGAEDLAWFLDRCVFEMSGSAGLPSGGWLVAVDRSGSPPTLTTRDSANRYHFVCNYLFEVGSHRA